MGNLVNRASFGEHREPTPREVLLSEIRQAYHLGNWKRANDLKKHYDKIVKKHNSKNANSNLDGLILSMQGDKRAS